MASVLSERVRGWRVHAWRRLPDPRRQLQHARRARQLHLQQLQADRERVPRAAAVRPPRHALGDRRLARGTAGRLLRRRHGQHDQDGRANYGFTAAVRIGAARRPPVAKCAVPRRRRRVLAVGPVAGRRRRTDRRRGLRRRPRPGREGHLPAHARHGGPRHADLRGLRTTRRLLRRDRSRLRGPRRRLHFRQVDYEAMQHSPSSGTPGSCSRCTAGSRRLFATTTTRCRSSCCRRSAAGRTCAASRAGGSAIVTAC